MDSFGFYVLGKKGYQCLKAFISEFDPSHVSFVISAHDHNIQKDYFKEIQDICKINDIPFGDIPVSKRKTVTLKFAIGWRWMIRDAENLIVFHDSLLPKYRGFSPLVNALINGESMVGVTALYAGCQYDSGDIIIQKSIEIKYPKKIKEAIEDISILYVEILLHICFKVFTKEDLPFHKQDNTKATFSPWRNEEDYFINWKKSSEYIDRFINAVGFPYNGAKTTINGKKIYILEAIPLKNVMVEDRSAHIGKILFMSNQKPAIICGEGLIQLSSILDDQGFQLIGKIPFRTRFGG